MYIIKIELSFLNNLKLHFDNNIPVFLNNLNNKIGECKISEDKKFGYEGELFLNQQVSNNLYVFYGNKENFDNTFWLVHILLDTRAPSKSNTKQLKDKII